MILILGFLAIALCAVNAYIPMGPYKQQILNIHNDVRRMEPAANMQMMKWNTQLEREATAWAGQCMFDHQNQGRGENLAMHTAPWDFSRLISVGIQMWADEKRQYTYGSSGFSQATGHYTQMVWAETTDVGCGMTRCPSLSMGGGSPMANAWYLVCFYSPPGNYIGQLPYVSGPKCSQCGHGQSCFRGLCSSGPAPSTSAHGGTGGHGGGAPAGHGGHGGGAPAGHGGHGGGAPAGHGGHGGGAPAGHGGHGGGAPAGHGGHGGGAPAGHGGHGGGAPVGGHGPAPGGPFTNSGGSLIGAGPGGVEAVINGLNGGGGGGSPTGHGPDPGAPMSTGGGGSPGVDVFINGHGQPHGGAMPGHGPMTGNTGSGPHPSSPTIGGDPGIPRIEYIGGMPTISVGTPPGGSQGGSGGSPGSSAGLPGTSLISKTPFGQIHLWEWTTGFQPTQGSGQGCRDRQTWCATWGELCMDPKHSTKMASQCPRTCNKCQGGGPGGAGPGGSGGQGACTDSVEGCMFWKQIGMCNIPFYQSYIMETCALTCNLC